jgi:hypothetical protein
LRSGAAPSIGVNVVVEGILGAIHVSEEAVVVQQYLDSAGIESAEELDGAVIERFPGFHVHTAKQRHGLRAPAPPHVVGEFLKGLEPLRQMRQNGERTNRSRRHASYLVIFTH